ncbi:MAG: hypothetical protein RBG13Loki_2419 [Promethearchaeota archaeon CR_4]|nr:MAG: hypothetical protein RBG13Loki_2419 [Candidatus Lokiarchaeota archaeon CR_4]
MQAQSDQKLRAPTHLGLLLKEAGSIALQAVNLDKENHPASTIPLYLHAAHLILESTILLTNGQGRFDFVKKAEEYLHRAKALIAQEITRNAEDNRKVTQIVDMSR